MSHTSVESHGPGQSSKDHTQAVLVCNSSSPSSSSSGADTTRTTIAPSLDAPRNEITYVEPIEILPKESATQSNVPNDTVRLTTAFTSTVAESWPGGGRICSCAAPACLSSPKDTDSEISNREDPRTSPVHDDGENKQSVESDSSGRQSPSQRQDSRRNRSSCTWVCTDTPGPLVFNYVATIACTVVGIIFVCLKLHWWTAVVYGLLGLASLYFLTLTMVTEPGWLLPVPPLNPAAIARAQRFAPWIIPHPILSATGGAPNFALHDSAGTATETPTRAAARAAIVSHTAVPVSVPTFSGEPNLSADTDTFVASTATSSTFPSSEERREELEVKNNKVVLCTAKSMRLKFCSACSLYRPPLSSHCQQCGVCTLDSDHHCPWVGTHVGRRNHGYFFMFTLALNAMAVSLWIMCIYLIVEESNNLGTSEEAIRENPIALLFIILGSLIGCCLCGMNCGRFVLLTFRVNQKQFSNAMTGSALVVTVNSYGSLQGSSAQASQLLPRRSDDVFTLPSPSRSRRLQTASDNEMVPVWSQSSPPSTAESCCASVEEPLSGKKSLEIASLTSVLARCCAGLCTLWCSKQVKSTFRFTDRASRTGRVDRPVTAYVKQFPLSVTPAAAADVRLQCGRSVDQVGDPQIGCGPDELLGRNLPSGEREVILTGVLAQAYWTMLERYIMGLAEVEEDVMRAQHQV